MTKTPGLSLAALAFLGACTSAEPAPPLERPYDRPLERFPSEFTYVCPDFNQVDWVCPFRAEKADKVSFSGPEIVELDGDLHDPSEFNYDLFYDTLRLIDSVPAGATLHATTYYFTDSPWGRAVRDALLCAAERGVMVHLIVGSPIEPTLEGTIEEDPATEDMLKALQVYAASSPTLTVHGCTGGCLRDDDSQEGKQHSKFFAASRVCNGNHWDTNITAVSSNNFTSSLVKRDNATVFKRNDQKIYNAFVRYFEAMVAAEEEGDYFSNYYDAPDGNGGLLGSGLGADINYTYHLFPRRGGSDPIDEALSRVECEDGTEVRVAMSRWTTARDYLVDELLGLAQEGCKVRVLLGDEPTEYALRDYILDASATVPLEYFDYRRLPSSTFHDKYFMIGGEMGDPLGRKNWVWTGSHNYSYSSLNRNEESALTIFNGDLDYDGLPDNEIYEAFLAHFEWQWFRAGELGLPFSDGTPTGADSPG